MTWILGCGTPSEWPNGLQMGVPNHLQVQGPYPPSMDPSLHGHSWFLNRGY